MGGHLSRSLLWESNYSSSTGGKIYSRDTRKCDVVFKDGIVQVVVIAKLFLFSR